MFWIVCTVLLGIVFWLGIAWYGLNRGTPDSGASIGVAVSICAAIVWVLLSAV